MTQPAARAGARSSVSELTARLKTHRRSRRSRGLAVEGEISNCRQWSSGHIYFTLKDDHAQMRAVMFRMTARQLAASSPKTACASSRAAASASTKLKGEYQIDRATRSSRTGSARCRRRSSSSSASCRPKGCSTRRASARLPVLPRRIGVVTSLDGAAVRDILRMLTQRHPDRARRRPAARVQGDGAATDLVRALRAIARVAGHRRRHHRPRRRIGRRSLGVQRRGAGARDCGLPGAGDFRRRPRSRFHIADFVADVRAATPSNAAELVVDRADNFRARIDRADARGCARRSRMAHERRRQRADRARAPAASVARARRPARSRRQELAAASARTPWRDRRGRRGQRFDALRRRLERRDVRRVAAELQTRLVRADGRIARSSERRRLAAEARVRRLAARLDALSPLAVLGRGYAVCWNEARTSIIRSAATVRARRARARDARRGRARRAASKATRITPRSPANLAHD